MSTATMPPWHELWQRNPDLKPAMLTWAPQGAPYYDPEEGRQFPAEFEGYMLNGLPCEDDVAAPICRDAAFRCLLKRKAIQRDTWLSLRIASGSDRLDQKLFELCGAVLDRDLPGEPPCPTSSAGSQTPWSGTSSPAGSLS
jgi:hypothetical protein